MKALIIIISLLSCFAANAQTIHFIIVSDINGSSEGVAAGRITEYLKDKTFVPNLKFHTGMKVNVVDVSGNVFSLGNMNDKLAQLNTADDDVIFFYYCGHGFNAGVPSDPYPTFWFGNNSQTRSFVSVYNDLIVKPHRLLIAIAEACNKEIESRPINREIAVNGYFAPKTGKTEKYQKLFYFSSGNYIMCSSNKGEISHVGNSWGCFSRAFIDAFETAVEYNNNHTPTWDEIFNKIAARTDSLSYNEFGEPQHPRWQKGYVKVDGYATPASPDALAQYKKGTSYYNAQNYTEAVKCFRIAANQGYADAQFWLGYCYYRGFGVEQEDIFAAPWFEKAAKQGHAAAQYYYGVCCEYGFRGQTADKQEAFEWYKKSAAQGNADAIKKLKNK